MAWFGCSRHTKYVPHFVVSIGLVSSAHVDIDVCGHLPTAKA